LCNWTNLEINFGKGGQSFRNPQVFASSTQQGIQLNDSPIEPAKAHIVPSTDRTVLIFKGQGGLENPRIISSRLKVPPEQFAGIADIYS